MHDLILEIVVLSPESGLPFIAYTNPHLMIGVDEVQLGEPPSSTKPFKGFPNEG